MSDYPVKDTSTTQPGGQLGPSTTLTATPPTPAHASGGLPVTGGDIASLTLMGAMAFAVGVWLVRRTRKGAR